MKRIVLLFVAVFLAVSVNAVRAAEEKAAVPAAAEKAHSLHSGKENGAAMMMQCPMLKQQKEIKTIVRDILQLQQRSLTAGAKEKKEIGKEIARLIKKLDALPDKMNCPMRQQQKASDDKKDSPGDGKKEETKPSAHSH